MIVWGGSGADYFDSGGRYEPASDSWTPTTRVDAPSPRTGHAGEWTGDSLTLWGGYDGGYLGTGGRYCACASSVYFLDGDGDGCGDPGASVLLCALSPGYSEVWTDCDDADAGVWGTPTETPDLMFSDAGTLTWSPPGGPGAQSVSYDLLRSEDPADFVAAFCAAAGTPITQGSDSDLPPPGGIYFYLVRAKNGCPLGLGGLGSASDGTPRPGASCP
jgi:hypothetical protein